MFNITAPNGSNDAFYIKIDQHYGSSDHVTYMQYGIPAVMFITWPDMWYHSSQDTPDKQDSTQYKRAAVVATGALAVIASGGDQMAARVTSENLSRGSERMGVAQRKATSYLADAATPEALHAAWKEARVAIRHQGDRREGVIGSSGVLYADPAAAAKQLAPIAASIDKTTDAADSNRRSAAYALHAQRIGHASRSTTRRRPPDEKEAWNLIVECAGQATFSGAVAQEARAAAERGVPAARRVRPVRRVRRLPVPRRPAGADAGDRAAVRAAAAHERRAEHPARQEAQRAGDSRLPVGRVRAGAARRRHGGAARARDRGDDQAGCAPGASGAGEEEIGFGL